jgi:hypothetical protein
MSTTVARRPRVRKDFRTLVRDAEIHILCGGRSARVLARDIGASPATTARVLAELKRRVRARGGELVSVRRGRRSHYEIREDNTAAWERFLREAVEIRNSLRGVPQRGAPLREEDHDRIIYGI